MGAVLLPHLGATDSHTPWTSTAGSPHQGDALAANQRDMVSDASGASAGQPESGGQNARPMVLQTPIARTSWVARLGTMGRLIGAASTGT